MSLKTLEGLAGTGKTYKIKEICSNLKNDKILYITYTREVMVATKKQINKSNVIVHTIHSLMYNELRYLNLLPAELVNFDINTDVKSEAFKELENIFIHHFSNYNDFHIIPDVTNIFVDEYQNVSTDLIKVVKLLCQQLNVDLYLVGDRYQSIYGYLEERKDVDNFCNIEIDFDKCIDDTIIFNKNHRSKDSILSLINKYLSINIPIKDEYLYNSCTSEDFQSISYFTNKYDELEYVKTTCLRLHEDNANSSIAILSRWKRNTVSVNTWINEERIDWIQTSNIHSFNGKEADIVFIVGYEKPDSYEEKKIIYTGISRARDSLYITSSFPFTDPKNTFSQGIIVNNNQRSISKQYCEQLPNIKINSNLTQKKFDKCSIDSISLKIKSENVPYNMYIQHQSGLTKNIYQKSYIDNTSVPIKISYSNSQRSYFFEMSDVNLLRSSGYNNKQVIIFISDYILKFFNYQIGRENINLHSIDICRIVTSTDPLYLLFKEGNMKIKNTPGKASIDSNGFEILKEIITDDDIKKGTVYYNYCNKRTKDFTIAIYRPVDKNGVSLDILGKNNRYNNKNAIKIELRYRNSGLYKRYAFGVKDITGQYLLNRAEEDKFYFDEIFDKSIEYRRKK
jgi:hypothetical protein